MKVSNIPKWLWSRPLIIKLGLVIVVLGLAGFVYTRFQGGSSATPNYQTATAEKGTLVASVTASGQVTSDNSTSVDTSVTGVIKKVYVENGQEVKGGDKIADVELDQASQQQYSQALASYQSAKNNLDSAKTRLYSLQASMLGQWDEYKELSETDEYKDTGSDSRNLPEFMIPQNEWLAAEAEYKNQQAVIAQAQTSLNNAWLALQQVSPTIYAPISGTVTGLSLQTGSVIASQASTADSAGSQRIASIVTQAAPTIDVNLTEVDVTQVEVGDKVSVTVDALPDMTFTGLVVSIDTMGSVSSGVTTYPAIIRLDTQVEDILSNMTAQVSIITDTRNDVLVIPSSAIQSVNGEAVVNVLRNGQVEQITIQTGLVAATETEVTSGINEGDEVITNAPLTTTAGQNSTTQSVFSGMGGMGGGGAMVIRKGG